MPNQQAPITAKPCKGPFNYPALAISSQFSSIWRFRPFSIFTMRKDQINFEPFELLSKGIAILSSIGNQALQALSLEATAFLGHLHRFEFFFDERKFRGRCRGKSASQRNTLALDHHLPLRFFAPFVRPNSDSLFRRGEASVDKGL